MPRTPESLASKSAWFVRGDFGVIGTRFVLVVLSNRAARVRDGMGKDVLKTFGGIFRWR